ncbi:hypothetical protein E1A91_A09G025800v1, partial [Gossypium mustelinum]
SCSACGHEVEDIIHVLQDCFVAKEVWTQVVLSDQQCRFFSGNLYDWFVYNLSCHERLTGRRVIWSYLFRIIAWRLWKNKNMFIFQEVFWMILEVVNVSFNWTRQYES